ncbi:MAG: XRE family transcriptional regulator [Thermodesulfobacteriota bacterium]
MDQILQNLAKKLRELRRERKLTLQQMAKEIGMSPSLVSQVERGMLRPSLETLLRIAKLFDVSPGHLLDEDFFNNSALHNVSLVRAKERKSVLTQGNIKFSLLSHRLNLGSEFIIIEYPPNSSTGKSGYAHEGVECGLLLEGELEVEIEDRIYRLKPGDSITYRSTSPHRTCNRSSKKAKAVWVNSEPFIFSTK